MDCRRTVGRARREGSGASGGLPNPTSVTESPYRSAWVSIGYAAVVLTTVPLALRIEDAPQAVLAEAAVLICYLGILRATMTGPRAETVGERLR